VDAFVDVVADVDGAVPVHHDAPRVEEACSCAHGIGEAPHPSRDGRDGAVRRDAAQAVVVGVSHEQAAIAGYREATRVVKAGIWAFAVLVPRLAAGPCEQRDKPCRRQM